MIPHYSVKTIPLLGSDTFSFFFFLAFILGYLFSLYRCRQKGIRWSELNEFFILTTLPACFGAHFFEVFTYRSHELVQNPELVFRMNAGLASMGGVLTFLVFFFLFTKLKKNTCNWKVWLDIAAQGFIIGLLTGRIGCALIHDHIGNETEFILGVQFISGAVRHDLGLYEAIYLLLVILPASLYAYRKYTAAGIQSALFAILYAPARFLLDFLRMGEVRYGGLTPAQYACVALLLSGLYVYRQSGSETS